MQYLEDVDSSSLCVPPAPHSQMYSGSLSQGESSPHPVDLCSSNMCTWSGRGGGKVAEKCS